MRARACARAYACVCVCVRVFVCESESVHLCVRECVHVRVCACARVTYVASIEQVKARYMTPFNRLVGGILVSTSRKKQSDCAGADSNQVTAHAQSCFRPLMTLQCTTSERGLVRG